MVLASPLGRGLLVFLLGHSVVGRGTVKLASVLDLSEERAARVSGAGGIPSSRPMGVIMKPCGHDRDELNHGTRPHRLVGHAVPELRRGRARHHAASAVARQRISPSRRP
jgi:hypothetical protein